MRHYAQVHAPMEADFISFISIKLGLAKNTVTSYCSHINRFLNFLNNRPPTKLLLEEYLYQLREHNQNNHSINTTMAAIFKLQEYYRDRGLGIEFYEGFKFLKVERKIVDILTVDEIRTLLGTTLHRKSTGTRLRGDGSFLLFTEALAKTGARFSELADLRVKNVSDERIVIEMTKNNMSRYVYIPYDLSDRIQDAIQLKDPDERVFTNNAGQRMRENDFITNLRTRCAAAGIKKHVYPHLFRHSFCTELAVNGAKVEEIKEIVGHKDIATTVYYVHLAQSQIKKAVFKHPLLRETLDASDILDEAKKIIESLQLERDPRFNFKILKTDNSLVLNIHSRISNKILTGF